MKGHTQSAILQKTTKILAGHNIPVHTEGFAPRVEYDVKTNQPVRVFLPEVPDDAPQELADALQGYIDHECGHILESSNADICDKTKSKLWHYIHNCIEDPRINAKMSDRYPGCERNIRNGYNFLFKHIDPKTGKCNYDKSFVDTIDLTNEEEVKDRQVGYSSVWFAKKANCRFHGPKYDDLDLDRLYRDLEAKMDPKQLAKLAATRTTDEVREAADYFEQFFKRELKEPEKPNPTKGSDQPKEKGEPSRLDDPASLEDELAECIAEEVEAILGEEASTFHFSDRFDKIVTKHDIVKGKSVSVNGFETKVKTVSNYLNKDLRRMLEARNRRWYTGGFRSGKLNQGALHSVRTGNDRIFMKKSEIRDVKAAVSLLIDLSGSMKWPREGESKVEVACQSAYAFAMVLDQLKVPYEIWGFCTSVADMRKKAAWDAFEATIDPSTASRVINPYCSDILYAFKRFDENFDIVAKSALMIASEQGVAMLNNEDSRHVQAALTRLSTRPEDKRTLFVFSDGSPLFNPGENEPSHTHLRNLDQRSQELYGADIYSIGIMDGGVSHYYKNYKVVSKLEELPNALFEFLKTRI